MSGLALSHVQLSQIIVGSTEKQSHTMIKVHTYAFSLKYLSYSVFIVSKTFTYSYKTHAMI